MEEFRGYIDHIIFRSEESGYTVFSAVQDGKELTLVGTVSSLAAGETIRAKGHETKHPIYGLQFVIESYEAEAPGDKEALERYLGSGAVKGIGPATASRIVKQFGMETMRIISEEPERLSEIRGISRKKAMDIAASLNARRDMQDAVIFLQGYGISVNLAGKIYAQYKNKLYDLIRENPYRLSEDIEGIGFQKCDEIARRAGIAEESEFRLESGILYALSQSEIQGHCYLPLKLLQTTAEELLSLSIPDFPACLSDLQMRGKIKVKGERVYRSSLYYAERETAALLLSLNRNLGGSEEEETERRIAEITGEEGIELDPLQRQAVSIAAESGLLVITGGPGTGKTTTIRTLLRLFSMERKTIALAAPTGRAAKRMSESTGWEAKTIHRLLEYQGRPEDEEGGKRGGRGHFERDESNPLDCELLIIDEMSMVDLRLMHALLRAVSQGCRLILVGDADQLPSVGAGNVLRDIISSELVRTISLKHIFRQAMESDIVVNAHRINEGREVDLGKPSRDFLFIRSGSPEQITQSVTRLLLEKLPAYLKTDPLSIQVMTPQRKGALGVERLNPLLQAELNPPGREKAEKELNGTLFRLGDKVMQVRNNYNLVWELRGRFGIAIETGEGVFNGDIGIIREINALRETLTVDFDGRSVEYRFKDCEDLDLAYAITIHKSQGSEYPAVVIPMYQGPQLLMNRNLLYTAVTRAKRCVCLVGDPGAFRAMLENGTEAKRYSSLAEQLRELASGAEHPFLAESFP